MNPLQGKLLVASPHLTNSPFERTVILVVEHTPAGVKGVVLNKTIDATIGELWRQLNETPLSDSPVEHKFPGQSRLGAPIETTEKPVEKPAETASFAGVSGSNTPQTIPSINRKVNFGGPVAGPLLALHSAKGLAEGKVPPGVYVAAEKDHLEQLLQQQQHPYRFYIGHASWEPGQLEKELEHGVWMVAGANVSHIFEAEGPQFWTNAIRRIGLSVIQSDARVKHIPADPSLN